MEEVFYLNLRKRLASYLDEVEAGSPVTILRRNPRDYEIRKAAVLISKAEYDRLAASVEDKQ